MCGCQGRPPKEARPSRLGIPVPGVRRTASPRHVPEPPADTGRSRCPRAVPADSWADASSRPAGQTPCRLDPSVAPSVIERLAHELPARCGPNLSIAWRPDCSMCLLCAGHRSTSMLTHPVDGEVHQVPLPHQFRGRVADFADLENAGRLERSPDVFEITAVE